MSWISLRSQVGAAQGYLRDPKRIRRLSDHAETNPFDCDCKSCMKARSILDGLRFAYSEIRERQEKAKKAGIVEPDAPAPAPGEKGAEE